MDFTLLDHEATLQDINQYNYDNQKIGVIIEIRNNENKLLLQQRGIKSRDENGLYEDIGGKVDNNDKTFKDAIIRVLKEEIGSNAIIDISDSIGIFHCYKNDINWIFIIYLGTYLEGEIKIMEPEKCQGYKFFTYEEVMNFELVTEGCKFLTKSIRENVVK